MVNRPLTALLVYERGFAGTRLDYVKAATGTSKAQLYHYFADKDALIGEVIRAQLGRIIATQEAAGLHEVSSWEGLQRWCDHFVTATRATQGAGAARSARSWANWPTSPSPRGACSRCALPNGSRICPRDSRPCATMANSLHMPTRPSSR